MNDLSIFLLIVGGAAALMYGIIFIAEMCTYKKWRWWWGPEEHRAMTFDEWRGYLCRYKELEKRHEEEQKKERGWSDGWNRAEAEWERKRNEASKDESN